ncbi:unnamed protein product [Chilo suppressalis]|uniref:FP protein C-terminal domain-containing protein n=1 Tax=Chilo suppressalis TaxID=168631 RepID=A0ABN8AWU8_CHISP|nr:unnamed protein product [Chilo suppressalis]
MTLRHSPPPAPLVPDAPAPHSTSTEANVTNVRDRSCTGMSLGVQHYDSAPDLRLMLDNATERKKRKFEDKDSSVSEIIKEMFSSFTQEQKLRFNQLQATINSLTEQNNALTHSVDMMSSKYDAFLAKISEMETQRKADQKLICLLEDKVEYLERKQKSTAIEIRNVPKKTDESKNDLCKLVQNIGNTISAEIDNCYLKDVYRLNSNKSSNSNLIIVEFTSTLVRNNLLEKLKTFNKDRIPGEKLNTRQLDWHGPCKPVYISEALTNKAQRLFYLARTFQKQNGYAFCWSSHGVVYLRKEEKSPHIKLNSESDIENLRKSI